MDQNTKLLLSSRWAPAAAVNCKWVAGSISVSHYFKVFMVTLQKQLSAINKPSLTSLCHSLQLGRPLSKVSSVWVILRMHLQIWQVVYAALKIKSIALQHPGHCSIQDFDVKWINIRWCFEAFNTSLVVPLAAVGHWSTLTSIWQLQGLLSRSYGCSSLHSISGTSVCPVYSTSNRKEVEPFHRGPSLLSHSGLCNHCK